MLISRSSSDSKLWQSLLSFSSTYICPPVIAGCLLDDPSRIRRTLMQATQSSRHSLDATIAQDHRGHHCQRPLREDSSSLPCVFIVFIKSKGCAFVHSVFFRFANRPLNLRPLCCTLHEPPVQISSWISTSPCARGMLLAAVYVSARAIKGWQSRTLSLSSIPSLPSGAVSDCFSRLYPFPTQYGTYSYFNRVWSRTRKLLHSIFFKYISFFAS